MQLEDMHSRLTSEMSKIFYPNAVTEWVGSHLYPLIARVKACKTTALDQLRKIPGCSIGIFHDSLPMVLEEAETSDNSSDKDTNNSANKGDHHTVSSSDSNHQSQSCSFSNSHKNKETVCSTDPSKSSCAKSTQETVKAAFCESGNMQSKHFNQDSHTQVKIENNNYLLSDPTEELKSMDAS